MIDESVETHHEYYDGYGISFWRGGAASTRSKADRARVYIRPQSYPDWEFDWPRQRLEVERLQEAFSRIYRAGIYAAKEEIRKVIGAADR